jgi:pilus assembly protein CpaB
MNRNRLLMIGLVALALGFFVSFSVYNKMKTKGQPVAQAGAEALVAARNIEVGNKLLPDDVRIAHFVPESLPQNYFRKPSEVLGRGIVLPIAKGEFILPGKLAEEGAGSGLPAKIPRGMRAVSVRVNDIVSIAGYVQPGTHVDVLVTGSPTGGDQQTTTVLENVAVLATGTKLTASASGDTPDQTSVITLAVSPDDAQKLALASTEGRIQLALRNPLDDRREGLSSVSVNNLYRKGVPPPAPVQGPRRPRPASTVQPPPAPSVFTVEMIRGDKKEEQKF